jgi:hypothetical protein
MQLKSTANTHQSSQIVYQVCKAIFQLPIIFQVLGLFSVFQWNWLSLPVPASEMRASTTVPLVTVFLFSDESQASEFQSYGKI